MNKITIPSRRGRRQGDWRSGLLVVAVLLILVVGGSFLNNTFGRVVLAAASPFLRFGNQLVRTIQGANSALRFKQSLVLENNQLKQHVVELEAALSDRQVLATDNILLREEIGLVRDNPNLSVAEILSHPWNSPFDIILATVPTDSPVAVGDLVTFKKNVWAGEVESRAGNSIKIKLISAPDFAVPVLIGENNVSALATGKGSGNLEVRLPRNLDIEVGDLVVSAETSTPLVVGTVGGVDNDPGESLQTILIHTPINLAFVRYLEIHDR